MDTVTMSRILYTGRFVNECIEYMFLRVYAKEHNLAYQYPWWPGVDIFDFHDRPGITDANLPICEDTDPSDMTKSKVLTTTPKNVDLRGYFQFHTSYYKPYKDFIMELFTTKKNINDQMVEVEKSIRKDGKKIIGIHLRRGDYYGGKKYFFITQPGWVKDCLKSYNLDDYVLYICSEEIDNVLEDFKEYNTASALDYRIDFPSWSREIQPEEPRWLVQPFGRDFADLWMLMNSDVLLISNSSYSFWAAMLNQKCKEFYRPRFSKNTFIPFDPWDSEFLFRDEGPRRNQRAAWHEKQKELGRPKWPRNAKNYWSK
jgi:hypothetical protein